MAEVREEGELGASVDEVWKVVGDFVGMIEGMGVPVEATGTGIGMTRTIAMGATPVVERLEERDEAAKKLVYAILEGPLPVASYVSTMQLSDAGGGRSKLVWSSTFEPVGDEAAAKQVVSSIYTGGIAALQGRFGA
ncbi:MAG: hypothetical protein QOI47_257 [Actinomycetota bacterium]|jgi:hypothetical protein|nr:hypothetical protein [Actinomycetota bacterium]